MLSFRLPALYIVSNLMGYNAFLIPYSLAQAIPCIIWAPIPVGFTELPDVCKEGAEKEKMVEGILPLVPGPKIGQGKVDNPGSLLAADPARWAPCPSDQ